jgi:prepilin-type N-terminal cleavage/methylation domain-containing protein
MNSKRMSGFSLIELLVVVGILLLLAGMALAIFNAGKSSEKMRSGARNAQSAFLGAKDRALHAKDLRGVRLTRDQTNQNLINGFVFVQSLGVLTYPQGSIQIERIDLVDNATGNAPPDGIADYADIAIVHGFDGTEAGPPASPYVDWALPTGSPKSQFFESPGRIKIPSGSTGSWYQFVVNTSGKYAFGQGNEYLQLVGSLNMAGPFIAPMPAVLAVDRTLTFASCDIQLGNDVLPFYQPITLPSGCVIDLAYCNSPVQILAGYNQPIGPGGYPLIDVMFSPRGNVSGTAGALGVLCFTLRDIRDATNRLDPAAPNLQGDTLILGVFPQTGLVQTFDADLTDAVINATGLPGSDGAADNLFNFAQRGMAAGR